MRVLISTTEPLTPALSNVPVPASVIPAFVSAGHEVYVAAPPGAPVEQLRAAWRVQAVLPLLPGERWPALALNLFRVGYWSRRWCPDLFLSRGTRSALVAQAGRGASSGQGLSVFLLPTLRDQQGDRLAAFLERQAIQQCDRLITFDQQMAALLRDRYSARGGDLFVLNGNEASTFVPFCERLLAEPPGFK